MTRPAPEKWRLDVAAWQRRINPQLVVREVARFYKMRPAQLTGASRVSSIVRARHVAMYLLRTVAGWSYPQIGRYMGGRDHTTAISAIRHVQAEMDPFLAGELAELRSAIAPEPLPRTPQVTFAEMSGGVDP